MAIGSVGRMDDIGKMRIVHRIGKGLVFETETGMLPIMPAAQAGHRHIGPHPVIDLNAGTIAPEFECQLPIRGDHIGDRIGGLAAGVEHHADVIVDRRSIGVAHGARLAQVIDGPARGQDGARGAKSAPSSV